MSYKNKILTCNFLVTVSILISMVLFFLPNTPQNIVIVSSSLSILFSHIGIVFTFLHFDNPFDEVNRLSLFILLIVPPFVVYDVFFVGIDIIELFLWVAIILMLLFNTISYGLNLDELEPGEEQTNPVNKPLGPDEVEEIDWEEYT